MFCYTNTFPSLFPKPWIHLGLKSLMMGKKQEKFCLYLRTIICAYNSTKAQLCHSCLQVLPLLRLVLGYHLPISSQGKKPAPSNLWDKYKGLSIKEKIKLLDWLEAGVSLSVTKKGFLVCFSAHCDIKKVKDKLCTFAHTSKCIEDWTR